MKGTKNKILKNNSFYWVQIISWIYTKFKKTKSVHIDLKKCQKSCENNN